MHSKSNILYYMFLLSWLEKANLLKSYLNLLLLLLLLFFLLKIF